ncbi:hypothetical protein [Planomicrobium sp. MB-3u-38]|uniref:hypothetical protein n=1 Tax=Planomicrobium sp. MB-3u-38 TaxID=2058318 RepID=UPI000C7965BE|nr:hypothetical protein [Planomicrobium sp. MB-3u-38]PKH11444.1 hypothetical protein CXF70_04785 [Planomicrobium sp. MB-3u-38]
MKTFKNEKGYALLMVLMLILLFTVLGMGLMATNMNSAKQFSTKENQVQARHQAEMGVLHYGVVLEDKVKRSSATAISCTDIDALLGTTKKLSKDDYFIEPANGSASCKEVDSGKLLEVTIKSTGTVQGETQKKVEATFYIDNLGSSLDGVAENTNIINPPLTEPENAQKRDSYIVTKHSGEALSTINNSLVINKSLSTGRGASTVFKAKKHLFIKGVNGISLDTNNHACIGVGGNFTALNKIDWGGQSSIELLVRQDAYFPTSIDNWKSDKTIIFIFGNLYLPENYTYKTHNNNLAVKGDMQVYIQGKVFQNSRSNVFKEVIAHPFYKMDQTSMDRANSLSCAVPKMEEENIKTPNWIVQDDINISYQ